MFDRTGLDAELDTFDNAGPGESGPRPQVTLPAPVRRRKSLRQVIQHWGVNLLVAPVLFTLCLAIAAEGLRELLGVMRTRLYRLPLPGAARLRGFEGWESLDLAHLASGLLFLAVTVVWVRVIGESKGVGPVAGYWKASPIAFGVYAFIAAVLILADAFVFYTGLDARRSGWNDTPIYVPAAATLLYVAGVAAFAAFHQNYHQGEQV